MIVSDKGAVLKAVFMQKWEYISAHFYLFMHKKNVAFSACESVLTKEMPMWAEYEKLPATDKSDQFLAFGCLFPPVKSAEVMQHLVAVPRNHRQMATMHL